jgi:hypothetical protein
MKVLIIVMSLFLMKGCYENKNIEKIKIQYVAETRGYYKSVKIENKEFLVTNVRDGEYQKINLEDNEWKLLSDLFSEIDLEEFENLIGPTKERNFDKKAFGNLFITKNNKTYQTRGFDHTIPPTEIQPFVDLILEYSKRE